MLYGNITTVKKNAAVRRFSDEVNAELTSYWSLVYISSPGGTCQDEVRYIVVNQNYIYEYDFFIFC